jgi:uncharacterized protein (TIGR00288 family)
MPAPHDPNLPEKQIAVFVDFENLALGVQDAKFDKFRLDLCVNRLVERGRVIYKRAYADWGRYRSEKNSFHESNFELVEIPKKSISGKNSADIRMVVDALDLCYTRSHLDMFALLSGDSDFSPLVAKLSEYGKHVIGLGVKNSTADILVSVCDEFIYYDDLVREQRQPRARKTPGVPEKQAALFDLLADALEALQRQDYEVLWGSMVKQQIKRKLPSFSENYYGFRTFHEVLEAARKSGIIDLQKDQKSGSYIVTNVASAP